MYRKDKNKFLLYGSGNYIQYPMVNHNGEEYEKEYIYIMYIYEYYMHNIYIYVKVAQSYLTLCDPWTICPCNSPDQNTSG